MFWLCALAEISSFLDNLPTILLRVKVTSQESQIAYLAIHLDVRVHPQILQSGFVLLRFEPASLPMKTKIARVRMFQHYDLCIPKVAFRELVSGK